MASISNAMSSQPNPFHPSDVFHSCAMSPFPPPPGRRGQHEPLCGDSPTHSANAAPPPVNLPPLSSIDPRQQRPSHSPSPTEVQNQPQQPGLPEHIPQYGTLLPGMSQYYGSQLSTSGHYIGGPLAPIAVASASSRFAIAPTSDPNSMISGGRHKKEVKKRTKTGCMTCRKRRIKVGNPKALISSTSNSFSCSVRWLRQKKSVFKPVLEGCKQLVRRKCYQASHRRLHPPRFSLLRETEIVRRIDGGLEFLQFGSGITACSPPNSKMASLAARLCPSAHISLSPSCYPSGIVCRIQVSLTSFEH
jgi:hypothetical protein